MSARDRAGMSVAEREDLAQMLAGTIAPHLALAVQRRDDARIADLLTGLSRQELIALAVVLADQIPQPRTRPNDGVIDEIAIARAVAGEPVPLSRPERIHAVQLMAARGATTNEIACRLHVSGATVHKILGQPDTRHKESA